MKSEGRTLPPFPVDDFTLTQLEHALNTVIRITDDGEWVPVSANNTDGNGGEFTLSRFLQFMSGHDLERATHIGYIGDVPLYEAWDEQYTEHCVIRALVAEIRRLREAVG